MKKGIVKWYNDNKGYGFLAVSDNPSDDVFVHFSAIEGGGFLTLLENEEVEYEDMKGPRGAQAVRVIRKGIK